MQKFRGCVKPLRIIHQLNTKLSKTQLQRIQPSGGFLGRILGPLVTIDLFFMKNVLKPVAKSILIPSGLTAAASTTDAAIHKKFLDQTWLH